MSVRMCELTLVRGDQPQMGAYHAIDLELNVPFTLAKGRWDTVVLERLKSATNIVEQADVACVVMSSGLAHVCLISGEMTVVRAKIEHSIPKKRIGSSGHTKGVKRFFQLVYEVGAHATSGQGPAPFRKT